ncbi:MAG: [FeFe] hydrogenase H-cluster maturation GTPase HydF [Clostridiales bacterium]|jgi:[FeFe] hydrogenase H-cluster maturation GTPase HydF|nr:[FeFe] hydrogenase H-cluster maturation GTPase HydF [Clostridiales bacterium]
MSSALSSNRKHIVLFGETNAGKSSLFNALLGQSRAIVSEIPGTTADPVSKAMELHGYGAVTLVDTAGLGDESELGEARVQKTKRWLDLADLALYIIEPAKFNEEKFESMAAAFKERRMPFLLVWTKKDLAGNETPLLRGFRSVSVSVSDPDSITALRAAIIEILQKETAPEKSLIAGLVPKGGVVLLIAPLDAEAPEGRLILPQVQLIRACLDENIRCHITVPETLPEALSELPRIDLAITDSQVFKQVGEIIPPEIPLTSFSILTARQKGDLAALYEGAQQIKLLKPGDRVLIAEACTHNTSHEDIGRVKIPRALEKAAGGKLAFTFYAGKEFPEDLEDFKLVVHCGGCMLTPRMFWARQNGAITRGVPFTNYGMALAACTGILERATAIRKAAK